MKFRFDNMDAVTNAYFSRQLEQIRSGILEVQFPGLHWSEWVPMSEGVNPGAHEFTARTYESFGKAELASSMSSRGRRADVAGTEESTKIRSMQSAYGYTIQDIRESQMAGVDLPGRKARAAKKAIDQLIDDIMLLGDGTAPYLGLRGLFKLSGTSTFSPVTTAWVTGTPDQILHELNGIVHGVVDSTKDVEHPNTMVMPLSLHTHISTRARSSTSDTTILEYFLRNQQYIKSVRPSNKLETAGASSGKRIVVFDKNPDKIEGILPVPFEQFAPQLEGVEYVTECHGRIGGVFAHFPKSVSYADGYTLT